MRSAAPELMRGEMQVSIQVGINLKEVSTTPFHALRIKREQFQAQLSMGSGVTDVVNSSVSAPKI